MRKALLILFAILSLTLGFVGTTSAQSEIPANEAAELCREFNENGTLDALGLARGECVNIVKGPASENASNFFAGVCGIELNQEFLGVSKGPVHQGRQGTLRVTS
jgi:hypothetical protein